MHNFASATRFLSPESTEFFLKTSFPRTTMHPRRSRICLRIVIQGILYLRQDLLFWVQLLGLMLSKVSDDGIDSNISLTGLERFNPRKNSYQGRFPSTIYPNHCNPVPLFNSQVQTVKNLKFHKIYVTLPIRRLYGWQEEMGENGSRSFFFRLRFDDLHFF